MNSKHSIVFFSAGVILILGLFLVGIIPIGLMPEEAQQQQQEQIGDKSIPEIPLQQDNDDDGAVITQTKPIEQMDCDELKEFVMSFEKGWGSAISLYDEKCP